MLILSTLVVVFAGCTTDKNNQALARRAEIDYYNPNQEPYSKSRIETIYEPAGAESQSEEGKQNPFIERRGF